MDISNPDLRALAIATTGVRDIFMGHSAAEIICISDAIGIDALLNDLSNLLALKGYDGSQGSSSAIAHVDSTTHQVLDDIAHAAVALKDLRDGRPHDDIRGPKGQTGLGALVRHLVGNLRAAGIDDQGWWDCEATWDIRVKDPVVGDFSR